MDYDYGNDAIDDNMALGVSGNVDEVYRNYHLELDSHICDAASNFIPADTIPPPLTSKQPGDWMPYHSRLEFETAEFLYKKVQMSAGDINKLMYLWGLGLARHGDAPPFADHWDLYLTIDETPIGDVPWQSFSMKYGADADPASDLTPWMDATYTTWFRDPHTIICNMLGNPDFKKQDGLCTVFATRQWCNVMSGDWAWDQADEITKDPATHSSMFVPVILGSDKATVSVATGQNDYYPLYASIRNVHNNVRRAHRNAVAVISFLAIPKTTKKHSDDPHFRKFKKQLFHSSLSRILSSLKPAMSVPEVVQFRDRHFIHVVYGLGPYIADYPEQLVLGCVVQNWCAKCFSYPDNLDSGEGGLCLWEVVDTLCDKVDAGVLWEEWGVISDVVPFTNDFPCTDIHQLLALDILHQVIKGAFKDHLVAWVKKYLDKEHGKTRAKAILDNIDHRIAAALPFTGLCRFPQGRGFSQWTGNDSKALMKVYLPAIEGHDTLLQLSDYTGIQFDRFSLPCQHTLCHYSMLICLFGALNGICSSIMESKHIKAVKEPWRHSSKFNALGQMLLTNQRLDKLAASCSDFTARRMLDDSFILDHLAYLGTSSTCYNKSTTTTPQVAAAAAAATIRMATAAAAPTSTLMPTAATTTATAAAAVDDNNNNDGTNDHCDGDDDGREDIQINPADQADSEHPHLDEPGDGIIEGPRAQCDVKLARTHREFPLPHISPDLSNFFYSINSSQMTCTLPTPFPSAHVHDLRATSKYLIWLQPRCWWNAARTHSCSTIMTFPCTLVHWFKLIACHLLPIFDSDFAPDNLTLHNVLDIWPSFYVNRFVDHHAFKIAY
ncbi:uncharacterized protein EDB93DRAFT_1237974 [Suillus bovinus]|uniref:uncharacterized protein n=1 Tax=Suillus bovinus TaxID=48563 RepID=UPI001B87A664|nr:uncharacterized protein EDB93DRAFT_1237974 [Suillus bovinus]KAG2158764.1 hypothetical protein EDB93DRAFT_1237974 [Suillus bovinus]